jgi:hypothetical protein
MTRRPKYSNYHAVVLAGTLALLGSSNALGGTSRSQTRLK